MEHPSHNDCDSDEPSLQSPHFSAITEALLAHESFTTPQQPIASLLHKAVDKADGEKVEPLDDLGLAHFSTLRAFTQTRSDGKGSTFTKEAPRELLPRHYSLESEDNPARETSYHLTEHPLPSHCRNPETSSPGNYAKITPRSDSIQGAAGNPQSQPIKEMPAVPQHHQQIHAIPPPKAPASDPSNQARTITAPAKRTVTVSGKRKAAKRFVVNGQSYTVTRRLGKGGSGRVYEVVSATNEVWAFKTIPLKKLDDRGKAQIRNEVRLLESLTKVERVIYLADWAIDEAKKSLNIVMQLGQIDLDNIIKDHQQDHPGLDFVFIGYHWLEMLKCVADIHNLDIVHSDLKPANFVFAGGMLKLVDFGIANAISDETVNVYQDHLAGTPNYMAPETLKALSMPQSTHGDLSRLYRFGKPSDVWSLGCILYLMIYGRQPFAHIQGLVPKLLAISDPGHAIEYSAEGLGNIAVPSSYIRTMKACLSRDPSQRPTVHKLLERADGLLGPEGYMGKTVYATTQTMESILGEALRQAGVHVSVAEIEDLTGQVMEDIENGTLEAQGS